MEVKDVSVRRDDLAGQRGGTDGDLIEREALVGVEPEQMSD